MKRTDLFRRFAWIVGITFVAAVIALPSEWPVQFSLASQQVDLTLRRPVLTIPVLGRNFTLDFPLKQGLDIQGGMQVVLDADMTEIAEEDRDTALEAAREVMLRRVDLYGVAEPVVQPSRQGDQYRLIVELAGVDDPDQALQLIGTTAELDFRLQKESPAQFEATDSAALLNFLSSFEETGLTGKELNRASAQFDPQTSEPIVALEFTPEGTQLFSDITTNNTGDSLGIFIDGFPIMVPQISVPITTGQATITGGFDVEETKQLAIQLNAGALPVPISILEQRQLGASLGQESIQASLRAGLLGLGLVIAFMIMYYGYKGFLASLALVVYSVITLALYKLLGITVTLPGIAGLLLSIGMAVDANILIFERMKEELRLGKDFQQALELGFGRAWDSIKDANLATIATALVLINPFNLNFLNTSGLVRGFGITLLIGVVVSLFTGVFVTRTLLRLFLAPYSLKEGSND